MSMSDFMPLIAMVIVQLGFAGMNIISKLAMESGMKPLVLVAYRQIFATIATIPFAYFLERRSRPRISLWIIFQIFLCSLTGATLNQVLYFVGLEKTTPTIACALSNILPAVTFVLAAISRQEKVGMKKIGGQAKIIGTLVCVCGAMLLSFYHGKLIDMGQSNIHWAYADKMTKRDSGPSGGGGSLMGPLLVMASSIAWAVWFILQAGLSRSFPAPYTTTALMCFMATIQCSAIALVPHHTISDWSLNSPICLISAIYAGVVCNALAFCLMSWSIERKGALYVSVFSPLLLVMVAILSWAMLHEKLYVGTAAGSMMIIAGLYAVLWGKDREINNEGERGREAISKTENESSHHHHHHHHQHKDFDTSDLELQFPPPVLLTNPNYQSSN